MLDVTRARPRGRAREFVAWLETGRTQVLLAVLGLTAFLRLLYLWAPLSSDEGGFLLVAHQWATTDGDLYGNQWVDRPPGLLVVFRLADLLSVPLGDRAALRLVAMVLALVAVAAAWYAGRVVGGRRGALAASLVVAAFTSTPVFSGPRLMTGLPAVTLVTVSVALCLVATYEVRSRWARVLLALGVGVTAALALTMKQNFADAFVFAGVLWVLLGRRGWKFLGVAAVGAVLPLALVIVWGAAGPGLGELWEATYGFREQAVGVIIDSSTVAPERRMRVFGLALLGSGAVLVAAVAVRAVLRERRRPIAIAIVAVLAYAVIGIAGGGSWWRHYALQLAMPLALGAALAVRSGMIRFTRVAVAASLVSTAVAVAWLAPLTLTGRPSSGTAVGEWIGEHAVPGDAGLVAYGSPQVLRVAGLAAPYPYSWSLPVRVRDPGLERMTDLLGGDDAPEWLVEMGSFTWWGIDTDAFDDVVTRHYRKVANICGHTVFLRADVQRELDRTRWCPPLYGRTTS